MRNANSVSYRQRPAAGSKLPRPAAPADRRIARWIAATLAADPPRARSLIVTVWGDALAPHGGTLWLAGLIEVMAAFGIHERSVRTSVFRLAADGWLAGAAHGRRSRYRLTALGARAFADAYRRIYFPHGDGWDGRWQLVIAPPDSLGARARVALRNACAWSGFATLAPGIFARPLLAEAGAPLLDVPPATRARLVVLEAKDAAPGATTPLAPLATRAYDLAGLAARYRRFLARFGRAIDLFRGGPAAIDPRQSFVARALLIHAFRRVLLRDPLLPAALLPLDWPGTAAYALTRDFYRLVWRPADQFLAGALGDDFGPASDDFAKRFDGQLARSPRPL
jgi:phenylacetic acid degradation operon negative regulatory protein